MDVNDVMSAELIVLVKSRNFPLSVQAILSPDECCIALYPFRDSDVSVKHAVEVSRRDSSTGVLRLGFCYRLIKHSPFTQPLSPIYLRGNMDRRTRDPSTQGTYQRVTALNVDTLEPATVSILEHSLSSSSFSVTSDPSLAFPTSHVLYHTYSSCPPGWIVQHCSHPWI
jgi:hypothetical protein